MSLMNHDRRLHVDTKPDGSTPATSKRRRRVVDDLGQPLASADLYKSAPIPRKRPDQHRRRTPSSSADQLTIQACAGFIYPFFTSEHATPTRFRYEYCIPTLRPSFGSFVAPPLHKTPRPCTPRARCACPLDRAHVPSTCTCRLLARTNAQHEAHRRGYEYVQ